MLAQARAHTRTRAHITPSLLQYLSAPERHTATSTAEGAGRPAGWIQVQHLQGGVWAF